MLPGNTPPNTTKSPRLFSAFATFCAAILCTLTVFASSASAAKESEAISIKGQQWTARFEEGALTNLVDNAGRALVARPTPAKAGEMTLRCNGKEYYSTNTEPLAGTDGGASQLSNIKKLDGAKVGLHFKMDAASGDLVVFQNAETSAGGLEWAEWKIGYIPLDYNIIVPGGNGEVMTRDSPYPKKGFFYSLGWDAQLLVIEGAGHGFYVWMDDVAARPKSISVERTSQGWIILCRTINEAPFTGHTQLDRQRWRVNVYEGDWRVPAKRYRDWAQQAFNVKPLDQRHPEWAQDIRVVLTLLRMNHELLEEYAKQLDPKQTLLYLSHWRRQHFDRDAPNYDEFNPEALPFIRRAQALGFHVMLHVNFWGVTPGHPLMEEMGRYQVRDLNGKPMRYSNLNQKPPLYLNYISPASARWREEFIGRMKKLIQLSGADGIHLDQNFHSHNDMNGRIDGLSFNEGLLRYHEELRAALPGIALGGEGLNELTYRYMDFAQRHVWSIMGGTIDRAALSTAHPISSYLFSPYVRHYGWLGVPFPPEKPQVYAGWRENFIHWGIYPTIRQEWDVSPVTIRNAHGFLRQLLSEARIFQENRLNPDLDSEWPAGVAFPFRGANGARAAWMHNRAFMLNGREVERTIVDMESTDLPGTIDAWLFYNKQQIYGLKPERFYAYFNEPRDFTRTHIPAVPAGFDPDNARITDDFLLINLRRREKTVTDLVESLRKTETGVRLFDGRREAGKGIISGTHGAILRGTRGVLSMTPPSQGELSRDLESTAANDAIGLGEVYVVSKVKIPDSGQTWFLSAVSMDGRAVRTRKSDGMTFVIKAADGSRTISATAHARDETRTPLELDLTSFSGREIQIELSGNAGPSRNATEDRGVCHAPRVVSLENSGAGELVVANAPAGWRSAFDGDKSLPVSTVGNNTRITLAPSSRLVVLSNRAPSPAAAGIELTARKKNISLRDIWDNPLPEGKPRPVIETSAEGCSVSLPVRSKMVIDWPLVLPEKPVVFTTRLQQTAGQGGVGPLRARLAVNDEVLHSIDIPQKDYAPLEISLARFAGQRVVISLVLESKIHGWTDYKVEAKQPRLSPQP